MAEQLLGNAVPVLLARAVAKAILAYDEVSGKTNRGRKSAKKSLYGVDRNLFMRWMVREGCKEKYAKDSWSWLQHAKPHINEALLYKVYKDKDDLVYDFMRRAKAGEKNTASSRIKKSLDYFLTLRNKLHESKKGNLDFHV